MRITVLAGLTSALVWILIKMSMYLGGMMDSQIPGTLINIFCLLTAISVGLYLSKVKKKEATNALTDIKDGMSAGLPYTLVISVFLYFFYGTIDQDFTQHKINERITATEKMLGTDGEWEDFKVANPDYETYSKEQFIKEETDKIEAANSPRAIFVMSLLGGLMLGTFYSILVTAIYRKIIFR